jgi:hypothetical protein
MRRLHLWAVVGGVVLALAACGAEPGLSPQAGSSAPEADRRPVDVSTTISVPPTTDTVPPTSAGAGRARAVDTPALRLEATGQPWEWGEVGPRVEPGEQEVTAFATGLRANTAVRWCARPDRGTCFVRSDQRSDSRGRSVFRFIVPASVRPMPEARVTVAYRASGRVVARAPFAIMASTNASCPEGAPSCTPSENCDEECRRGLEECTGPDAATRCPDGF